MSVSVFLIVHKIYFWKRNELS